jgi:hypothetical protein
VDHLLPEYEKVLAQVAKTKAELKKELHEAICGDSQNGG